MSEFWELYKDPRWQKKRLEVMQAAGFRCVECGADSKTLNVHHAYYLREAAPWQYPDEALKCWCEPCHVQFHEAKRALERLFAAMRFGQIAKVVRYGTRLLGRPEPAAPLDDSETWHRIATARLPPETRALHEQIHVRLKACPKHDHEQALELLRQLRDLYRGNDHARGTPGTP